MPPSKPVSQLDANQVLQHAFDEDNQRLRTDAEATIVNADIDIVLEPDEDGVHIADKDTLVSLKVNSDGSINTKNDELLDELEEVNLELELQTDILNDISSDQTDIKNELTTISSSVTSIDNKLPNLGQNLSSNSISVVLASDSSPLNVSIELDAFTKPTVDNSLIVGSIDGSKNGIKYGFVNNLRTQILATHDREQEIVYADFGTKDQRIVEINYTSDTFPGVTARKTIEYTLVGN